MPTQALDVILAALALLGPFAIHLFFPVIPVVKVDFELSDALAQLTFSIGVFGMAFSTLAYGNFADRYGRRPVLLIGLALFFVGSVISTLAGSFASLLLADSCSPSEPDAGSPWPVRLPVTSTESADSSKRSPI